MLLEIENLNAGYRKTEVLHDVHLHIAAGETVGLIGPNGAGKSTMLKAIMGLCDVRSGRIRVSGDDVLGQPTHERLALGIGFVPQGRLVFPSLTVEENLRMGGYTLANRAVVRERLEDVYERLPRLLAIRTKRAGALSGGQQQLAAIGRALMTRPRVLLLDEPSLGLSPIICREVYGVLERLRADGVTLAIVEQNIHLVLGIADRIVCLANGSVRATGAPAEFHDPERMRELYFGS